MSLHEICLTRLAISIETNMTWILVSFVLGSKFQITTYQTEDCTGTSTTTSSDMGVCSLAADGKAVYSSTIATSPVTSPVKLPVKSPVILFPSSVLPTLKGYVATVAYSDTACKSLRLATLQLLDSCNRTNTDAYERITATTSSIHSATYKDSLCTHLKTSETTSYTDGVCHGGYKIFVTPTSAFTADVATFSRRYMSVWIIIMDSYQVLHLSILTYAIVITQQLSI